MMNLRWSNGKVLCPRCGSDNVDYLPNARVFKCYQKHERQKFSLKVGTIFEDSPIALEKWLPVMWLIVNAKNGISSWEIHRAIGVTQRDSCPMVAPNPDVARPSPNANDKDAWFLILFRDSPMSGLVTLRVASGGSGLHNQITDEHERPPRHAGASQGTLSIRAGCSPHHA
jgi:transposase-like protein